MLIYIGGAILAVIYLVNNIPGNIGEILSSTEIASKLSVFNLGFDKGFSGFFSQPYTLLSGLIGGAFLSMSSHGTDQLVVQRLLAAKNLGESKKALSHNWCNNNISVCAILSCWSFTFCLLWSAQYQV